MKDRAAPPNGPTEVFRSHSSIEAEVVCALLAAHSIDSLVSSALAPSVSLMPFGGAEFRVSVAASAAKKPPAEWDGLTLTKIKGIDTAYVRPGAGRLHVRSR